MKLKLPHQLTSYECRWLVMMSRSRRWSAIIAARGSAKTWTVALWCLLRCLGKRKRQITLVPGGKQTQGSQLFSYIEDIVDMNRRKLQHKIVNWSATRIKFLNGSVIQCNPPTKGGVQSARGDIIVDEAHLFPAVLGPKMEPIASKRGNRIILIGIPEHPSWFKDRWDTIPIEDRDDSIDWRSAVDAGVIDLEAVEDYRSHNTEVDFRINYENQWVLRSEFVFVVPPFPADREWNPIETTIGIDFNPMEGHAWVISESDRSDTWRIVDAGMTSRGNEGDILLELARKLIEIKSMQRVDRIIAEGNSLNDGYLNHLRSIVPFMIERNEWNEDGKASSVQRGIILSQQGRMFDDVGLAWDKVRLDDRGRMVEKVHTCDAALHSMTTARLGVVISQSRYARS